MTFIPMTSNLALYSLTKSKCHCSTFLFVTLKDKTFARHKMALPLEREKKLPFLHLE